MGLTPSAAPRSFSDQIPDYSPTVLETITRAPFSILNAPSNAVKSLIRAAKDQNLADVGNAVASLIPFAGSEDVPASDITGTDDFLTNLAFDTITDPLMIVGGVGSLTETGKAASLVADRALAVKALEKLGTVEDIAKAKTELDTAKDALATVKAANPNEPARSIIRVLGQDVGDFEDVKKLAGKINPMPDVRRAEYLKELGRTTRAMEKADPLSNDAAELLGKSQQLKDELDGMNKGVIPLDVADKLRSAVKTATALFAHKGDNDLLETGRDVMMSNIARDKNLIGKDAAELITNINTLAEQRGITTGEQLVRLTQGVEHRKTLTEGMPDIAKVVNEKSAAAYDKYLARLEAASGDITKQAEAFQKFKASVNRAKIVGEQTRLEHANFLEGVAKAPYSLAEYSAMDALASMSEGLPQLEKANLMVSETLTSSRGLLEYTRRLLTPEAKALRDKDRVSFNLMNSEIKTRIKSAMRRGTYPEKELITINNILKDTHGIKFDFFDTNIVKAMRDRRMQSIEGINRSQFVQFAIENMATETKLGKKEGYTVENFIHKLNGMSRKKISRPGMYDAEAFAKQYPGKYISRADADEIMHVHSILRNSLFNNNNGVGAIMGAIDKYVNAPFRVALTTLFPGYHNRNLVGNIANSWIGGVDPLKQAKYGLEAGKLQHAISTGTATAEQTKLWDKLVQWGIPGKGMNSELNKLFEQYGVKEGSKVNKFLERPLTGLLGRTQGVDPMMGRAWGRFIEDNSRIAHFLAKKAGGASDLEAMRSVNKYLFDFTKLTDFEKKFARPTVLFYSWIRNNIPLQLKTMITNPRFLEVYNNLTGQNNEDVPAYLRGASAFKNPVSEGSVVGSLGLPIEDLNFANIAAADPDMFSQLSALADKFVTRLTPAFRIPYEIAAGRTTFGRKPLSNLSPTGLAKEFTPISRGITSIEKVADPENTWTETFVDLLSGVRTYNVNDDRVALDRMKRALLKSGKFTRSGFLVLPKPEYKEDADVKKQSHKLQKAIRKLRD